MNKKEKNVYDAFLGVLEDELKKGLREDVISRAFLSFCQALATKSQIEHREKELEITKQINKLQ